MKKFLQEVITYFWIPLIMGVVSYIFFQLRDVLLGIITLVALSAVYTSLRLYFLHKKWWLLIILMVVVFASIGFFVMRAPAIGLSINGQEVTGTSVSFSAGSVSINPAPETNGKYTKNTVVTLTANPAPGYDWKSWSGTDNDASNPTTVTMSRDKQVKANFEPRFSLIINNQQVIGSLVSFTEGSVLVDPAPDGDGKYTSGTLVTLTARSNSGYDWKGWSATGNDTSNPTTVTMSSSNKHVTVTFESRFSLFISNQLVIGPVVSFAEGSVSVTPAPADDGKYAYGTRVTLTATALPGYGWKNWSGTGSDTSNPAIVTISSDKHVAVTFELRFLLAINNQVVTGSSVDFTGGTVSVNPAPGADGRYAKDSTATLTATPASGYRFDRWSGDVSGNAASITVTMNTGKSITATFIRTYTLTTSANPSEGGSVSPVGGTYDEGTSVTLAATPASGYRFDRWSGDVSGNVTSVTITMNANKSVTATFIRTYTLTTSVSPTEGGSVSPVGGTYDEGTSVTLTAIPASGYRFDHWSGDVSGNVTSVTITMNTNKSVTATFIKVYTLTTSVSPAEGGSVSPSSGTYDEGTSVILTAIPASGYRFDHWSGDVSGNVTSVTITMNANKNVTATFIKSAP